MLGAAVPSTFFCVAADPLRELEPDGGGDFKRGDVGHFGVFSPDLGAFGGFETPSATPVACSCGAFAADKALCIAAADGCDELGVDSGCGRLSFRMGDALRDVLGLFPADGLCCTKLFEGCFFNSGAEPFDVVEDIFAASSIFSFDAATAPVFSAGEVAVSPFNACGPGL
jgi:hypothetical protein